MIRSRDEYRVPLQVGRGTCISGERVKDASPQTVLMVMAIIPLLPPLQPKPGE